MLTAPERTASGRRIYGVTELRILAFVRRSRELGFSLNEIRALLRLGAPGRASCSEVKVIATHHLEDIRAKLSDLKKLERLLAKTVARCSGKKVPNCPVLDILDIRRERLSPSDRCSICILESHLVLPPPLAPPPLPPLFNPLPPTPP